MARLDSEAYKAYVAAQLERASSLLQDYAIGDFSDTIQVPEEEDVFTALFTALNTMADSIKKLIREKEATAAKLQQVEETLLESGARYRVLFENLPVGIAMATHEGRILAYNEAVRRMTGYSGVELGRIGVRDMLQDSQDGALLLNVLETKGFVRDAEVTFKRRDGTPYVVNLSITPTIIGDEEVLVVVAENVTGRKQAQAALRAYSELLAEMVADRTAELEEAQERITRQERLAFLGQLAGGISHELRNPLATIKNAAYFLNIAVEASGPEVKEALEIINNEVLRSENIVTSLLSFARPQPKMRCAVDVNSVVQEALSHIAVPDNVEVVNRLDETLPTIHADPDQLAWVFGNFILNAVQAMPAGGQLTLETAGGEAGWVTVSVVDTGMGIAEENLRKLFEPLFTTKAKGIGLGLAVSKMVVDGHEGVIEVQSVVGKGSAFVVKLPLGREAK